MALEAADAGVLKRDVVHLLLRHPQGIKLGDFSGAFYKLHGHHPQLALHGYSSLKYLLADIKNMVVLENGSQATVIKLASGIPFNIWLDKREGWSSSEEGWGSSEEEMQSLMNGETEDGADSGRTQPITDGETNQAPDAFVLIRDVVRMHPHGLKLKSLEQILKTKHGFNLTTFSISMGYEDALACLQDIPGLLLQKCKKAKNGVICLLSDPCGPASSLDTDFSACNSVPQKMGGNKSVLVAALVPVVGILQGYPNGLNLPTLVENLKKRGFDLEHFSQDMGYQSSIHCLLEMPGLHLNYSNDTVPHSCVVRLLSNSPGLPALPLQAGSSLHKPPSSSATGTFPQHLMEAKPAATEVLASVSNLLNTYEMGLQVKKLQKFLLTLRGFDLEKFSIARGYKDALEFLEHQMPELKFEYHKSRSSCVVKQGKMMKPKQSQGSQAKMTEPPTGVLALVSNLLNAYASGLRVKKLQEFLLTSKRFDLEKFSIARGYKDTLEFLEHQMPELKINYREDRSNCGVQQGQFKTKKQKQSQGSQAKMTKCPGVKPVLPLPNVQPPVEPTKTVGPPKAAPAPTEVLALVSNLLDAYASGLRVKKLQEFLLATKGFDLEKFSIARGYTDTLEFLEHQMPELKINYRDDRSNCGVQQGPGLKPVLPFPHVQPQVEPTKMVAPPNAAPTPKEVLALVSNVIKSYKLGLRVKKLQELLLTSQGFDLETFSIARGYKDTLEFLEHQMPRLKFEHHGSRSSCVVKQGPGIQSVFPLPNVQPPVGPTKMVAPPKAAPGPGVKPVLPLPNVQPQLKPTKTVGPPKAAPDFGGISKPFFRDATKARPDASGLLQNGLCSSIPVPSTVTPNHPSPKEQHGASSSKGKSSLQPYSDIPARQSSTCQSGGRSAAGELSHSTYASVLSKSSLTTPSPSEHLDELKQQVVHILAMHPEGMSLFQFRAAYSTTYQHHLPLGNASSAKQRLLEMSDIICMKGYGVQTLLLPVSPEELSTKPGPPVFSKVENAAVVLADSLSKTEVRPEPAAVSRPSLLKTRTEPQPHAPRPLASDHLTEPGIKENCVLPKGRCPTAPLQEPVRPKVSIGGHPDSSKAEEAAMNLGNSLPKAAVKIEPVVVAKSSIEPSLSKAAAMPVPQLPPSVPSTSTCSSLSESLLPRPPKPSVPVGKIIRARAMPEENLLTPHSPVVFLAEPQVPRLNGNWTSNSLASGPVYPVNPSFSVNIPVPSLFQPVLTNVVAMSQPVVYPPLTYLPDIRANPSFSLTSSQSLSTTLSGTQMQKTELVSSHLAQPAAQKRPTQPTSPIRRIEQTDLTRAGLDPLRSASRTQGHSPSPAPGVSADGHPISSPSVEPPSLQSLKSPSVRQPENVHHTWLNNMPCSSVPAADRVVAAPSAGVPSKPVVPACQKRYDAVDVPVTSPRTPSSSASQQPASSSRMCTEADTLPSKPRVSIPCHPCVDSAVTSNAQPPTVLHPSQGSPIRTASQPPCVPFRPNTVYDASRQNKPLPGISREGSEQDSPHSTLPGNQSCRLQEKPPQPCALQNSPPPQSSDNCVIL